MTIHDKHVTHLPESVAVGGEHGTPNNPGDKNSLCAHTHTQHARPPPSRVGRRGGRTRHTQRAGRQILSWRSPLKPSAQTGTRAEGTDCSEGERLRGFGRGFGWGAGRGGGRGGGRSVGLQYKHSEYKT